MSLVGVVVGAIDLPVTPLHEVGDARSVSALEAASHAKTGMANSIAESAPLVRLIRTLVVNAGREQRFPADEVLGGETEAAFLAAAEHIVDEERTAFVDPRHRDHRPGTHEEQQRGRRDKPPTTRRR